MMKYAYTSYVTHMLSYYIFTGGERPTFFRSSADEANWDAVHTVVTHPETVSKEEVAIAMTINRGHAFVKDKVADYVMNHDIDENTVWNALRNVEREIAQVRGLI